MSAQVLGKHSWYVLSIFTCLCAVILPRPGKALAVSQPVKVCIPAQSGDNQVSCPVLRPALLEQVGWDIVAHAQICTGP